MEKNSLRASELLGKLRGGYGAGESSLVADIEAMSRLGLYYAAKIRTAVYLRLSRGDGDEEKCRQAISQAETALYHWTQPIQVQWPNVTGPGDFPDAATP